jgi:hypothetical protein
VLFSAGTTAWFGGGETQMRPDAQSPLPLTLASPPELKKVQRSPSPWLEHPATTTTNAVPNKASPRTAVLRR